MQTIVFATHNKNKMREIKEIVKNIPGMEDFNIISMAEAGITEDIVEDGSTYEENALIKAKYVCEKTGLPAMADDSGVEIDALDGAPGVYSARFLGEDTPYSEKSQYIIDKLQGKTGDERKARYMCSIAIAFPDGRCDTTLGMLDGFIAPKSSDGIYGFAYDRIMYIPELGKTFAEAKPEEKNAISHRFKALVPACEILIENLKK